MTADGLVCKNGSLKSSVSKVINTLVTQRPSWNYLPRSIYTYKWFSIYYKVTRTDRLKSQVSIHMLQSLDVFPWPSNSGRRDLSLPPHVISLNWNSPWELPFSIHVCQKSTWRTHICNVWIYPLFKTDYWSTLSALTGSKSPESRKRRCFPSPITWEAQRPGRSCISELSPIFRKYTYTTTQLTRGKSHTFQSSCSSAAFPQFCL